VVLITSVILSFFFPWPWNLVVVLAGVIGEVGEIVWGRRLAKRWRPKTGAEAMIGKTAEVVENCRPAGHVRVDGELWEATCAAGADAGETVRITAVDRLTLTVVPVRAAAEDASSSAEGVQR
jgi:membrane protein implicated in regulation of membrane protease activity